MQSPVVAILWENWRLSRPEVTWRLALGIVGGAAVMALFAAVAPSKGSKDFGAVIALALVVVPNFIGWLSFLKLNGGLPGFPFYLLYTRPVRTAVLVGVPLAYVTVAPAAIYLVSALLLRVDIRLSVPTAARRRVDRRPQSGHGGGELVDPQPGRPDAGHDGCRRGMDRSGQSSPHRGD